MCAPSSLKMLITCAGRGPSAEMACGVQVRSLRTADGEVHAADAIFTAATIRPMDWFLDGLGLERNETPFASVVAVDQMGRTSHPRIWAAGNVVNPVASVPIAMGAGNHAGAAANGALVEEDVAAARG